MRANLVTVQLPSCAVRGVSIRSDPRTAQVTLGQCHVNPVERVAGLHAARLGHRTARCQATAPPPAATHSATPSRPQRLQPCVPHRPGRNARSHCPITRGLPCRLSTCPPACSPGRPTACRCPSICHSVLPVSAPPAAALPTSALPACTPSSCLSTLPCCLSTPPVLLVPRSVGTCTLWDAPWQDTSQSLAPGAARKEQRHPARRCT